MKRYFIHINFLKNVLTDEPPYKENVSGILMPGYVTLYLASDVEEERAAHEAEIDMYALELAAYKAELAKKDEEIARIEENYNLHIDIVARVEEENARLREALEEIRDMNAGSLIGSHYRDSIVDIAREALERKSP